MDKTTILVLLCVAGCCTALEVGIYGKQSYELKPGQGELNLVCHVNEGLSIMLSHAMLWVHVSLVDPASPVETVLTRQQTLEGDANPDVFGINFAYAEKSINNTLTVKSVSAAIDGKFICRADPLGDANNGESVQAEIDVAIINDVQSVELMFDGEDTVTGEATTAVQREEGEGYGVTCSAKGFSPREGVHMHVFKGEQELSPVAAPEVMFDTEASQADKARRYMASVTVSDITLMAADDGKKISCQARAGYDDSMTELASIPLTVISYEPVLKCDNNVSAWVGDKYVKIRCEVMYKDVEVDRYSFTIESNGQVIGPGDVTEGYDDVTVEDDPANHKAVVTLNLYQVSEMNFQTVYYLNVFLKNGQQFRQEAAIIKNESTGGATAVVMSYSAVFLLCFCVSALFSL